MTSPVIPGTAPARGPVYPPAIPTSDLPDAGGRTPVERAHRTQQAVAADYSRWRAAHSRDISPDVLKANAGAYAVSNPALQLPAVLDAVKQDSDAASAKVNDLIKGNRVPDDNVADQIAAQRYSSKWQRRLDALDGPKAVAAAQDLVNGASGPEIVVLSEELGDYLVSRNLPVGWLPDALAKVIPGVAEASADAILKARQHAVVTANHQRLQHAMESDLAAPPLIDPTTVTSTPYSDVYSDGSA